MQDKEFYINAIVLIYDDTRAFNEFENGFYFIYDENEEVDDENNDYNVHYK